MAKNNKSAGRRDALRRLLIHRCDELCTQALSAEKEVSQKHLLAAENLVRICQLLDFATPQRVRRQWVFGIYLTSSLIVVSILMTTRLPRASVRLDLEVSEASIIVNKDVVLFDRMPLTNLGVTRATEIDFPPTLTELHITNAAAILNDISLSVATVGGRTGSMASAPFRVSSNATVRLGYNGLSNQLRVSVESPTIEAAVDIMGPVNLSFVGPEHLPSFLDFGKSAKRIEFTCAPPATLEFGFQTNLDLGIFTPLSIKALQFARLKEFAANDGTLVYPRSTLIGGTVFVDSLGAKEYPMKYEDYLSFEIDDGIIEGIKLLPNRLALRFRGDVHDLETGAPGFRRNLMPTLFEWIAANRPISLAWGGLVFTFGLITTVGRWWKGD